MFVARHDNRVRRAFTLIELLVVVAIIGLLISILLPSLHRARQQARQLYCATNMRAQGQAAVLYAADNDDFLPRGIQIYRNDTIAGEYHIFATAILDYLGWTGNLNVSVRPNRTIGAVGDSSKLFGQPAVEAWGGTDWWRVLALVLASVEQLQCPSYPQGIPLDEDVQWARVPDNPNDYITNAFPMPYMQASMNADAGQLEWVEDPEPGGAPIEHAYIGVSRLDEFPAATSPANFIYITEVNTAMHWKTLGTRYHHAYLAAQLPFAAWSRIADDQRHPGGLNALFFDQHIETLDLHEIDVGYPNFRDKRLRHFTIMPDWWEPQP
jgi:prepilin-type N-terminal cleavage/methylation domain-containing protein/prepilin-type processing-associated H-X9-DG protein